jgi:hypothetical protein
MQFGPVKTLSRLAGGARNQKNDGANFLFARFVGSHALRSAGLAAASALIRAVSSGETGV